MEKKLKVKITSERPEDVSIKLDSGESLGNIQSLQIDCSVENTNIVKMESQLTDAEIEILDKYTEVTLVDERRNLIELAERACNFIYKIQDVNDPVVRKHLCEQAVDELTPYKLSPQFSPRLEDETLLEYAKRHGGRVKLTK